ncbi:MAG: hypothetical protein CL608_22415 [Anaerolineaceae bacterium]|nr:hypothetical protein [Anaerolineaceae bacterium]
MFQIGEFSRLGSVTIETLRHYDALGLLKPAKVDPSTGYRYYSAKQMQPLNRILALKEVGFSLEENMPVYEVTLKPVEALTVAAIRETVPTIEQMSQRMGELFHAIASWMMANNLSLGLPMIIYHDKSYTRENINIECAIPIGNIASDDIPSPEHPIVVRHTDAFPHVATTIVTEQKHESFKLAYNTLGQWIEDQGYCIVGPPRDIYYTPPGQEDFTAEIQFPVEKSVG